MLAGDVPELELLLIDRLVFIDQNGNRLGKDDDLAAHRSGLLSLKQIAIEGEPELTVLGEVALLWVTVKLSGTYAGKAFAGKFTYLRVWQREDRAWQVIAGHCAAVRR